MKLKAPHCGEAEPHFRRGYHHGAVMVVRALKAGVPIEEMEAFADTEIRAWRQNHYVPAWPPEPTLPNPESSR